LVFLLCGEIYKERSFNYSTPFLSLTMSIASQPPNAPVIKSGGGTEDDQSWGALPEQHQLPSGGDLGAIFARTATKHFTAKQLAAFAKCALEVEERQDEGQDDGTSRAQST
jgi:hypothetical protein